MLRPGLLQQPIIKSLKKENKNRIFDEEEIAIPSWNKSYYDVD
jgi:hypothetical protein